MSEEKKEWQVGDVVCLKSGSPPMTIVAQGANGGWIVSWFNLPTAGFGTQKFPSETLKASKPTPPARYP